MHSSVPVSRPARLPALALAICVWTLWGGTASASQTTVVVSAEPVRFATLTVGQNVYREVHVKSRDVRSVFFTHADGIASARLRDLPPEAQARLGFDPLTAPPEPPPPPKPTPTPQATKRAPDSENLASAKKRLARLFTAFDTPARPAPRASLQDDFARLDLTVKDQGRRPSCSVFAIVSALEFQFFQLHGRAEDFSEEYLIWATRRTLGLVGRDGLPARNSWGEIIGDTGFTLPSVVGALSTFGVALETEMPANLNGSFSTIATPERTLVELARLRRAAFIAAIPGRDQPALLNNIVHTLNAGLPVPAGILWADDEASRRGLLDQQIPLPYAGHAITFVGYECPTGRVEDAVFVFKNSYGTGWGNRGYGRATWRYLSRFLREAYVLEVSALPATR